MQGILVENQLAESLAEGCKCDKSVCYRHPNIPENSRVCQITLETRNRKFHGEECQYGICHSEIALSVLEVDRIHLMRHCRRSHLVLVHLLAEILHRNICPDVAAQVYENSVDTPQAVKNRSKIVIMFNLRSRERAPQTKGSHEIISESHPVNVRECHLVGVHVAGRTAELGRICELRELPELLLETYLVHLEFLAEPGRRSRLPVGLRKHRNVLPLLRHY